MSCIERRSAKSRIRRRTSAIMASAALTWACSTQPRPTVLTQVDAARQTGAPLEASPVAPQSYAQPEHHRQAAEQAWKAGRIASSQVAAERALAGYEQTQAAARVARAERQLAETQQRVDEAQKALGHMQAQLKLVSAEQAELEMQAKIEQDAEALSPPKPASPEREAARRDSARALHAQARALCAAARLLGAPAESLGAKAAALDSIEEQFNAARAPAPVDVAIRARTECLHELTLVRRPKIMNQPQGTEGDEIFVKLSSARLSPLRDDRGISVTYRDAFAANGLASSTVQALRQLEPVIKGNAETPILVVVHSNVANPARDEARGKSAAAVLEHLGARSTAVLVVGDRLPLLDRRKAGAQALNERLEVVFVLRAS